MALSERTKDDIKEYFYSKSKDLRLHPSYVEAILDRLFENWETVTDNTALQAQLVIDRIATQQAIHDKEKISLESAGYTVIEP